MQVSGRRRHNKKSAETNSVTGMRTRPSVMRESRFPSKSISESGTSAASRQTSTNRETTLFLNMPDPLLEERDDMRIDNAVIDFLAVAPRSDDAHLPQPAHVMRNC